MTAAGLPTMAAIQVRTSWQAALTWIVALGATMVATTMSLSGLYDSKAKIDSYASAAASGDALLAINGRIAGLDTLGGVVANEFGFLASFAVPLMGISLIARLTRKEERSGRLETVLAGRIGRTAPIVAAVALTSVALVAAALALVAGLVAAGVAAVDALLYSFALAAVGFVFAGIAAVAAQLVPHSRGVYGIGLAALVVAYLLRGIGAVLDNPVTWASPLGWAQEARAFGDSRWWPLVIPLAVGGVLIAVAVVLAARRDLGSALLRRSASEPAASAFLRTPLGMSVRLHRGTVVGWTIAAVIVGATFGALAQSLLEAIAGNAALADAFGGAGSASVDGVLAMSVLLVVLICGGYVVQAVGTIRDEETSGRLESTLSGDVGRWRWLATHVVVILCGLLAVGLLGSLALALATAWSTGDSGQLGSTLGATAAYLPAVLLLGAVALALFGALPGAAAVAWLVFAAAAVVAFLAEPLDMPEALTSLGPFNRVGFPPLEDVMATDLVVLAVVTVVLVSVAFLGFRRRGIPQS